MLPMFRARPFACGSIFRRFSQVKVARNSELDQKVDLLLSSNQTAAKETDLDVLEKILKDDCEQELEFTSMFNIMSEAMGDSKSVQDWKNHISAEDEQMKTFSTTEPVPTRELIDSEKETITSIFENIMRNKQRKSNPVHFDISKLSGFSVDTTPKLIEDIDHRDYGMKPRKPDSAASIQLENRNKLLKALEPTIKHLQAIPDDYSVIQYVNNLVARYQEVSASNTSLIENYAEIKKRSAQDPENPVVNHLTLSLLLKEAILCLQKIASPNAVNDIITMFESLKTSKPVEVMVYGCDIYVYNQMLEVFWDNYQDLNRIEALMLEIRMNAIYPNQETLEILKKISKNAHEMLTKGYKVNQLQDYLNEKYFGDIPSSDIWNEEEFHQLQRLDKLIMTFNYS